MLLLGCVLFLAALPLQAQLPTAKVAGTVTDPSGAVIPGAKITLTNTSNGFVYIGIANGSGEYVVPNLAPANYTLRVEAKGFNTYVQQGIGLVVNQAATVNPVLQLGSSIQTVEVSAAAPLLETSTAHLGQTVTGNEIRELPLVGRDATQLIALAPGIAPAPGSSAGSDNGMNFDPNGGRYQITDVTLDGVTQTGPDFEERGIVYVPSIDAIQEFKVEENNFSADTGFTGSTIVKMVMRSGTNQFHGSAYEFLRNNKLDANNTFSNAGGVALPALHWNDFGGTFGGPIKKDKTFFFGDYEGTRESTLSAYNAGVPSAAERTGNFGEICGYNGGTFNSAGLCSAAAGQLWDPYSGVYDSSIGGAARSALIPYNNLTTYMSPGSPALAGTPYQLPAVAGNLINPMSQKIMSYFPMPTANPASPGYNPYNNWAGGGANPTANNAVDAKVDHRFNQSTQLTGRFAHSWGLSDTAPCWNNPWDPCSGFPGRSWSWNGQATLTHNFGSNKVFTVTYGFARGGFVDSGFSGKYPNYNLVSDVGFPASLYQLAQIQGVATPTIDLNGAYNSLSAYNGSSIGSANSLFYDRRQSHDIVASLDWIRGHHDIKFGGEIRIAQQNTLDVNDPVGAFTFNTLGTSQNSASVNGGDVMATFLTGVSVGGSGGNWNIIQAPAWTAKTWSLYVEDSWRVTNKLTVNAGLRYDMQYPGTERHNRLEYFDPTLASPLQIAGLPNLVGGDVFATPSSRGMYPNRFYGAIQPRLGLAYRLNDKTVVRSGFGIFYEYYQYGAAVQDTAGSADGYMPSTPWITTYQNNGATPFGPINNPFPSGVTLPTGNTLGALTNVGLTPTGGVTYPGWATDPAEYSWNFSVQRQLPGNIVVEGSYVGQKGTHLLFGGYSNIDHLGPSVESLSTAQMTALDNYVSNPFYGTITNPNSCLSGPQVQASQLALPFPQFCGTNNIEPPFANSIYHALQLRAEKRLSNGLELTANYTWSKVLTDTPCNGQNVCWRGGGTPGIQDPNDLFVERSVATYNDPNLLNLAYTYKLPFGQKMHWGSSWKGVTDVLLGGWETTGIWTFDTGQPIPLTWNSCGTPIPTYGCQHLDLVGKLQKNPGVNLNQYFANANSVLQTPAPFTLGTAPQLSQVYSPGARNANLAIYKNFPLGRFREGASLQFRAETINAFNHVQYAAPNTTFQNPEFGVISSQLNSPRQIQLGMKLYF
ncbi:MAG: carboxypeptidase regulatory-like domain-containing protein [Terriglobia bacterium]